jgi:choline dehydrogenase-like flavoprotein
VRPALEHDNVTLLTGARALRLETDGPGTTVTGVVVERDGRNETMTGDIVVVACGAANSAKLLLATKDIDFPLGNIQTVGKSSAEMYRGEKPLQTRLAPEWTLDHVARHAVDFWLSTEDLPPPDNRVTLSDDGSIALRYTPSNDVPKQRLLHELKSMLKHLVMHHDHLLPRPAYLKNEIPVAGCAHQAGTCRFGTDPASPHAAERAHVA